MMLDSRCQSPLTVAQEHSETLKDMATPAPRFLDFGPFRIDVRRRRLFRDGDEVSLAVKTFDVLLALAGSGGRLVEKDDLMKEVWPDRFVEEGNLAQNVSILRKALGESPEAPRYIATVPRRGYRFIAEVDVVASDSVENSRAEPSRNAPTPVLCVLPFRMLAIGEVGEYLGVGMADALITRMSSIRGIVVRPTSAVMRYATGQKDPATAASDLGADTILEGTIRTNGQRIRVTVQLVSADGRTLWADRFDERFTEIFVVEDAIVERIVAALALHLLSGERARLAKRHTEDVHAHEFYLKGRYHANQYAPESFARSVEAFNRALDMTPTTHSPTPGWPKPTGSWRTSISTRAPRCVRVSNRRVRP